MSILSFSKDDLARLKGKVVSERYTLLRLINSGTYGAVYEVADARFPGVRIAIKMARLLFVEETGSFFKREAQLLRMLEHPNIVRVYDYGFWEGHAFIVMELLQGETLTTVIKEHDKHLPDKLIVQFVREIGAALEHSHEHECVHRDLKPDNILLVTTGTLRPDSRRPSQRFVLIDFGIATKTDEKGTLINSTGTGLGSPEYRSPEQVMSSRDVRLDENPSTDIYTFGVILFELLTGRLPFPMEDGSSVAFAKVTNAIAQERAPKLSKVAPDRHIKPVVEQLVLQCLEKDPSRRPQTIYEVRKRFLEVFDQPKAELKSASPKSLPKRRYGSLVPQGDAEVAETSPESSGQKAEAWSGRKASHLRYWFWTLVLIAATGSALVWTVWPHRSQSSDGPGSDGLLLEPSAIILHFENGRPESSHDTIHLKLPKSWNADDVDLAKVQLRPAAGAQNSPGKGIGWESSPQAVEKDSMLKAIVQITDPNLEAKEYSYEIVVSRKSDGARLTSSLPITVECAVAWTPDDFRGDTSLTGPRELIGNGVYYRRLIYNGPKIDPKDRDRLAFCLLNDHGDAFYMMEREVWNHLFRQWPDSSEAWNVLMNKKAGDVQNPLWPMRCVLPGEASKFARWLLGKGVRAGLPTQKEWLWAASGQGREKNWLEQFKGKKKIAVNTEDHRPRDVGKSQDDFVPASPADRNARVGFYDMAGNVSEWTRSLIDTGEAAECDDLKNESMDNTIIYVGNNFEEDLDTKPPKDPHSCSPRPVEEIGFRLVMHIEHNDPPH